MRGVLAVLIVAGCGRLGFDPAANTGDGPIDDDVDGDGVPVAQDNCPTAPNSDQDDEDGDLVGDVCDPCPPFVDTDDPDGDGIAGRCDPRPEASGDVIAHFAGFERLPADLILDGDWTASGGKLHVTGSLNSLAGATWIVTGDGETVSTDATIDQMFGNSVARPVGVVHELDVASRDGTICVFGINPANLQVYALADNRTSTAITLIEVPVAEGDSSTFASSRAGFEYRCIVERLATPMTGMNNLVTTPNRVGLYARSSSATFDWALVVTSP